MLKIHVTVAVAAIGLTIAPGAFAIAAQAKTDIKVLHAFAGAPNDGDRPKADVVFDSAGNLYGTTYNGGTSDNGAIFKIDAQGNETLLHSFDGSADGGQPAAGVTLDPDTGDLYGVTQSGGTSSAGTLYKLSAGGTFTVLHSFANSTSDGGYPQWRMIRDKQGNLYGVTNSGGMHGYGTLFKYSASGNLTNLYNFDNLSASPTGRLAMDSKGTLYGVTNVGGTSTACFGHGCGSVYEVTAGGTFATLYSFNNTDGRGPQGGLTIDKKGNLFGTTDFGGASDAGTVFEISANRQFATLFNFNISNGYSPTGEVLELKKNLYLTTYGGGANGVGALVKVSLKGKGKLLYSFSSADGSLPIAALVQRKSVLYGTASGQGADGHGAVFSLKIK